MSVSDKKQYGLMAEFDTPADLMHAAEEVRKAGYKEWDVYTPFPIHGMDEAMGLKNSIVGRFTFIGGLLGFSSGMAMIYFMNAYDYPLTVGGKPLFSPIFAFPVSYELTILLSAFGTLIGMALLNKLPRWHHPLLKNDRFKGVSYDKFYLVIEKGDKSFHRENTEKFLGNLGSKHIELVEE